MSGRSPDGTQCALKLLMVRPASFGFNAETAASNAFQNVVGADATVEEVAAVAVAEFDGAVATLRRAGVDVMVIDDTKEPCKPDAVFPNNWIVFHSKPRAVVVFPMEARNRRLERRSDVISMFTHDGTYAVHDALLAHEAEGRFCEGTGSVVLDREARVAFAALSSRTDADVLRQYCEYIGYDVCSFATRHPGRGDTAVYHTNVMMAVGRTVAVICLDVVVPEHREDVVKCLSERCRKRVLAISVAQMDMFAGNMLQVATAPGVYAWVMSQTARDTLMDAQVALLCEDGSAIISLAIPTIERIGGGSARCMLAEVHGEVAS